MSYRQHGPSPRNPEPSSVPDRQRQPSGADLTDALSDGTMPGGYRTGQAIAKGGIDLRVSAESPKGGKPNRKAVPLNRRSETPVLDQFSRDLTERAKLGESSAVVGREGEIERVTEILLRRTKSNPLLIGEAGVGKTALVEGLAAHLLSESVPPALRGARILELDLAMMLAGTNHRGQFEERIKAVVEEASRDRRIILFIDEIHTLIGAGDSRGGLDAANILKPELARGALKIIGASTPREARRFEQDPALTRRFQSVLLAPPSPEETIKILEARLPEFEFHHRVTITGEAITLSVQLSERFIQDRQQPDKAIDVLDEACARARVNAGGPSEREKQLQQQLQLAEQAVKDLASRPNGADSALIRATEIRRQLQTDLGAAREERIRRDIPVVDQALVRDTVSMMTGIPVQRVQGDEAKLLLDLEGRLARRVVNQPEAVAAVASAMRRGRAGLSDERRPLGSFLFVGQSGVGKTALAKALAAETFGSEDHMIAIDMSEFMERSSVAKLIGAPPGYVGYDQGGLLVERVRRRPHTVVLFDEVEKAHPDVFNLLLQVLEEGRLTDSLGRHADFRNTVIVMTSNLGAHEARAGGFGFGAGSSAAPQHARDAVQRAVEQFFRPEFINRLDATVVFNPLSRDDVREIVHREITNELGARLENLGVKLELTESAYDFLVERGFHPEYGARPVRRAVERYVEDPLASLLIEGRVQRGARVLVRAENHALEFLFGGADSIRVSPHMHAASAFVR